MYSSDSKKRKNAMDTSTQQNIIANGTTITGDIVSKGAFRIDGVIEGNIKTEGKIVVGKTGVINGTLHGVNVDIEGQFKGELSLSGTLSLRSTAHIEGNVQVNKLAIEPGATFNATCAMGAVKNLASEANGKDNNKKGRSA